MMKMLNFQNVLVKSFNEEFQRKDKEIQNEDFEFKAIAFKTVEQYYLQCLPKILERNKAQKKIIQNLILEFLTDHRFFGPVSIPYFSPSMMNDEKRITCEEKFEALKKKATVETEKCYKSTIFYWLALRYLKCYGDDRLNKVAELLKYSKDGAWIRTNFNINDEKYVENVSLLSFIGIDNALGCFTAAIKAELVSLVEKLGHYPVSPPANYRCTSPCYLCLSDGWFYIYYKSTPPSPPQVQKAGEGVSVNDVSTIVFFFLLCFFLHMIFKN